jgi:hypothetical protein
MPDSEKDRKHPLGDHILASYFFLRLGMAVIALALPPVLWLGGKFWMNTQLQNSMSAYYHTEMRDVFVGCLCAVGCYLLLYKGFSRAEDWALNLAGIFAIGIAFFPMSDMELLRCAPLCGDDCMMLSPLLDRTFQPLLASGFHGYFAVAFFLLIAFVCIWCSRDTLKLIENRNERRLFSLVYKVLGTLMIVLPLTVATLSLLGKGPADVCRNPMVYRIEFAAVWIFSLFWAVKSVELYRSKVEFHYPVRRAVKNAPAK